ncbi:porin family protein [Polluticoccus soli]|uniref:porin family protein n=1 Tax=Polluticoccus soli TaxID=3034150 RepID=UPI0023E0B673|nr:porin family protein [Flavipsychrobacter sp. JY13-12]
MKKLLLVAASAMLFAGSANAQVRFAPEVGFNISKLHYNTDFDVADDWNLDEKSFTGIRAGVAVDICLANHLTLQPGIYYSRKGGERLFTFWNNRPVVTPFTDNVILGNNHVIADGSTIQERVVLSYIEIPLLLNYYFDAGPGRIFIGAGPTFSFGVNGDLHLEIDQPNNGVHDLDNEYDLDFGDDGLLRGSDIGIMANVGYDFDFGLFVRPFYNWGLSNLSHQDRFDNIDIHNRTFGVGFGWWFGGKNKN